MYCLRALLVSAVGFLLAIAAPAVANDFDVLVWGTGNASGHTQSVADYISASGKFTTVTAVDSNFVSLATLTQYDAVLYFSSTSAGQDSVAIGNVLADYADTGARLVLATFAWANQNENTLGGRIITAGISPVITEGDSKYTNVTIDSMDGSAFFEDVTSIDGFFHDDVTPTASATVRATWSDGEPLLATKENVVAVNLFPDSSWGSVNGDYPELFANALSAGTGISIEATTWGLIKTLYR